MHQMGGNPMLGLMQDLPLLCHRIIDYAAANAGDRPVVPRSIEGPIHTTNYAEIRQRALRLAQRLERDGIQLGEVCHAWGMTEMSPLGTLCSLKPEYASLTGDARLDVQMKQGHSPFGVEMKITDDQGRRMPWDGKTFGRLKVRGFAVAKAYFKEDSNVLDEEGFFDTGDVGTIDKYGYLNITDRSKDVIKSGGEWISSIELENVAVSHPKVA